MPIADEVLVLLRRIEVLERECHIRRTEHIETCKRVDELERENAAMAKVVEAVRHAVELGYFEEGGSTVGMIRDALAALAPATSKEPT